MRVRPRAGVRSAELDGRIVVFNDRTGRVRSLNATGSVVWPHLDGTCSVADLAAAISDELGVDHATAHADVREFVADLLRHGFVERVR
jgi:hypothetical protein